ncbi:site-specific DNA-methyltransferase [Kangiella profundi]|uniref:site-specific DNA-methyltransferase (adenine-specific) n=1 Tax=Kangiella profundi TaxID=1561924 RepID=A0A2K9AUG8_9GAMM|nr:site-specific DNA-methyltransferase [Kangiella profundi]
MDGKTLDIVTDNINKLKELFPEAITEGKVDFDVLKEVLGEYVDDREERYSFTWNGKSKARRLAQIPSTGTLRPCKEESVDWDNTQNLFIEGDNLEVLKLLQKSYHKKVKMIYIDPPYNTGKDFVYKDNFKDNIKNYKEITRQVDSQGKNLSSNTETSGRYHTDWLNMMYPRLKLARNLLADDGVIFISADEEITNLKKMCDEIFGEENFVENITWNKRIPKNDKGVGNIHEYVLLYAKDASLKPEFNMRKDGLDDIYELVEKLKKNRTPILEAEDEIKKLYKKNAYDRGITLYNSFDHEYRLWGKINMSWPNANTFGPNYEVKHPKTGQPVKIPDRGWRWTEDTFNEAAKRVNGNYTEITELPDGSFMCGKIWFSAKENQQPSSVTYLDEVNTFLLRSILSMKSDGGMEVERLFSGKSYFSYPKPTSLLKVLLSSYTNGQNGLILDFFAGSATTAHAALQLNAEDGRNRKFIMVQLPEACDEKSEAFKAGYKNIAEISKERIRRSAAKIKEENPEYNDDLGFKVFKLDSTNIKPWKLDFDMTEQDLLDQVENIKPGRTEDDVLYEVLLKYGLDLTLPIEEHAIAGHKVFDIGAGALIICLSDNITLEVVEGIAQLKEKLNPEIMRVVFKDSGFKDDVVKTNTLQILKQANIKDIRSL